MGVSRSGFMLEYSARSALSEIPLFSWDPVRKSEEYAAPLALPHGKNCTCSFQITGRHWDHIGIANLSAGASWLRANCPPERVERGRRDGYAAEKLAEVEA
jgi:hypothetical protein